MTIQPIVENAILHGIEPTGTYGEIRIGARKEGEDLDGVLKDRGKKNKNSMSGIGTRVTVRIPEER